MIVQGLKRLKKVQSERSGHNPAPECLKTGKDYTSKERFGKETTTSISIKYRKTVNEEPNPKRLKVKGNLISGSFEYKQIS